MVTRVFPRFLAAVLLSAATIHAAELVEAKAGVAIHVCAGASQPALDLASTGRWVVQSLCPNARTTAMVRAAFTTAGVYGLASAEHRADLRSLPYARRVANRLIVDDMQEAQSRGLIREGTYWHGGGRQMWMLSCRDAFNGTLQWVRPWNGTHAKRVKRPLAMAGGRIFTIEAGRLTATDLRDGRILYAAEAPVQFDEKSWLHCNATVAAVHDPIAKVLHVFDAATGRQLWHGPQAVQFPVLLDGDRIYACVAAAAEGQPEQPASLLAMQAASGAEIWRKSARAFGDGKGPLTLSAAADGRVLATVPPGVTAVIDGATGDLLRGFDAVAEHILSDRVLIVEKAGRTSTGVFYDIATGKRIGTGAAPNRSMSLGLYACAEGAYTEKMLLDLMESAGDPARRGKSPLPFPYLGTSRPHVTCISGGGVAHGMIYQPQQGCRCGHFRAGLRVLYALAPVDMPPPQKAFEEPGEREKGEVFGQVDATPEDAGDWPILRANPTRSCSTSAAADPRGIAWRTPLGVRPDAWIVKSSWRAQHNHNQVISGPVVAAGKVFVSLIDEHQVVALDEKSGAVAWRYTAESRIDSPPTIHRGLCMFGSRGGWVYCLRAADGRLAWRRRIAPAEERILVYGQLESRWPVTGTILVDGDRGYATAGHDPGMNIMVWEFEPATGKTIGYRPTRPTYPNDMLVKGEDGIYLNRNAVDAAAPTTGPPGWLAALAPYNPPTAMHLSALDTPIISAADTLSLKPRGGLYLRQIVANRWTWDPRHMIGFTAEGYGKPSKAMRPGLAPDAITKSAVFCLDPARLDGKANDAVRWQTPAKDVWALALAGPRVIVAGPRIDRPKPGSRPSSTPPSEPTPLPTGRPADELWDDAVLSTMMGQWVERQQDPLVAPGFVHVLDAADGGRLADIDLPAAVVQDGIAVSRGRVYATTADGAVCCLQGSTP